MKIVIEGNLPHWLYKKWLNSVRVTLGQADESGGILRYFRHFRQKNNLQMNSSESHNSGIISGTRGLSILQRVIHIQIPIASELHIIYHTTPRFRPSTII